MSKHYLFRVEILSKKDKHPLESIAYYSGEKQFDLNNNKTYETTTGDKVIWSKILVPEKNVEHPLFIELPDYLKFRSQKADLISNARNILWQNVNNRENRPDSQFSRLFELSIPHFFSEAEGVNLINQYARILISDGMIVDASLHSHNKKAPVLSILERIKLIQAPKLEQNEFSDKPQDYTSFLMCTLRDYKSGQFGNKNRNWNNPLKLKEWRAIWINLLLNSIDACSEATEEDKDSWRTKFTIYPEYNNMKTHSM